jgi:hypothetical protein
MITQGDNSDSDDSTKWFTPGTDSFSEKSPKVLETKNRTKTHTNEKGAGMG